MFSDAHEQVAESFSEWQARTSEFLLQRHDEWHSLVVRLQNRWAHAATSQNQTRTQQQQQQVVMPITSPLSLVAPAPRLDGASAENDAVVDATALSQQQQRQGAGGGVIVQPLMWLVFSSGQQEEHRRLLFAQPLPPDLAIAADASPFDVAQWHANRLRCLVVEHTPAHLRPKRIAAAASGLSATDPDYDRRCAAFTAQSFATQGKLQRAASGTVDASDEPDVVVIADDESGTNIVSELERRLAASDQLHLIPPDQSDPPFASLLPPDSLSALFAVASAAALTRPSSLDAPRIVQFSAASAESFPRYAVVVPFPSSSADKQHQKQMRLAKSMSMMHLSRGPVSFGARDERQLLHPTIGSVRLYRDLGDALAARDALDGSTKESAADWSDVLAPTQGCGGEIVIEFWRGPELLCAKDAAVMSVAANQPQGTATVFPHGFVQQPRSDAAASESDRQVQQRIAEAAGGAADVAALGLSRRGLTRGEIESAVVPWLRHLADASAAYADDPAALRLQLCEGGAATACAWCGRVRQTNKRCGGCLCAAYCCVAHQTLHYKKGGSHKQECRQLKQAREEMEALIAARPASSPPSQQQRVENAEAAFARAVAQSVGAASSPPKSVIVQLPKSTTASSVQLAAEAIADSLAPPTQGGITFVTLCCGTDCAEDCLRVLQRSAATRKTEWLPPSTQLGDIWCEQQQQQQQGQAPTPLWLLAGDAACGVVCRVHMRASASTVAGVPLPRQQQQQEHQQSAAAAVVVVVTQGHDGLSFFDQRAADCAEMLLRHRAAEVFLVADSRFGAETAVRAVLLASGVNDSGAILHSILAPTQQSLDSGVIPPQATDKVLLPRLPCGFVARLRAT